MAKPILFIDAYQTCIETGDDALGKAFSDAFTLLSQKGAIPPEISFSVFSKECDLVYKDILKKYNVDNPILIDDSIIFKTVFQNLGIDISKEVYKSLAQEKWRFFREKISLYADTIPALNELRNDFVLILCVDGVAKYEGKIMEQLGLKEVFDFITITSEIGSSKAQERTWKEILNKYKCSAEQGIVIDDRPTVLEAASAAGLKTVRVRRGKYVIEENILTPSFEVSSLKDVVMVIKKEVLKNK